MLTRRAVLSLLGTAAAATGLGCAPPEQAVAPEATLTKGPFVQVVDATTVRLVIETREDVELIVLITGPDGTAGRTATRRVDQVDWAYGVPEGDHPVDEAGQHVLHEIIIEDLTPGVLYAWQVDTRPRGPVEGTFLAPPAAAQDVAVGWLADTMFPTSADVAARLLALEPDLIVHGGDLQYTINPVDTWNGLFHILAPLLARAPLQVTLGNHEDDLEGERAGLFERLFVGQGGRDEARHHDVPFGRLHLVILDSETGDLDDPDGAEAAFARAALSRAEDGGRIPVLIFHRPTWTLSRHWRRETAVRDTVHQLARGFSVPLVLSGHTHGYERFEVDGVTYVVDGGGGALLYDLDENVEAAEAARPGESDRRRVAERSFGCTRITATAEGLTLLRVASDGTTTDEITLPT